MNQVVELYAKYSEDTNISLNQLVKYAFDKYSVKLNVTQVRNILSHAVYVKADKKLYDNRIYTAYTLYAENLFVINLLMRL